VTKNALSNISNIIFFVLSAKFHLVADVKLIRITIFQIIYSM